MCVCVCVGVNGTTNIAFCNDFVREVTLGSLQNIHFSFLKLTPKNPFSWNLQKLSRVQVFSMGKIGLPICKYHYGNIILIGYQHIYHVMS